jgi:hypothetical protein
MTATRRTAIAFFAGHRNGLYEGWHDGFIAGFTLGSASIAAIAVLVRMLATWWT